MSYSQLIHHLFRINSFSGVKLGLNNCRQLQALLEYPDKCYECIHIAGTNGKGSVAVKIASALEKSGYRVGLYTSPHISSFRERIKINSQMISEEDVEVILTSLFQLAENHAIPATFFELTTFLALAYFSKQKVDFAILETGLGGRLDATNIVSPLLSVITSISLDHTEILGKNEEEIAKEKAGIIKPGIPVVIGPHTPQNFFKKYAHQYNCPYIAVDQNSALYEEENKSIAKAALQYLSASLGLLDQAISAGLEEKPACRFEIVQQSPAIILDVAHNPDGLTHLFLALKLRYPDQPLRILFGLSKSKDLKSCVNIIKQHGKYFHIVEATNGRGAALKELQGLMEVDDAFVSCHFRISEGVEEAAREAALNSQILVICGTFFIMGQARKALGILEPTDEVDLNEIPTSEINN
ncbi:MAG: bifunctional folylpolyglutamate synthase/dihydrofolate synthase [Candidatus Protochlamydia sp.]|nr:bifunctional folylpolyglutamate synthase/dihydrofolate synthase [Candidatus Protochlamydia sp.]